MDTKQVIVMRKDLNMRKGKMCAQASHASLGVFTNMMTGNSFGAKEEYTEYSFRVKNDGAIEDWFKNSYKKITVGVNSEEELLSLYEKAKEFGLPCILITDSGLTEFNGIPTNTCIAIGPAEDWEIDSITGGLKLL